MSRVAASILGMEMIVVALAVPVSLNVSDVDVAAAWIWAGAVIVLCIVGAVTVRRGRPGYVIGSLAQVGAVGMGVITPMMFVLGGIFALLWLVLLRIGPTVERQSESGTAK